MSGRLDCVTCPFRDRAEACWASPPHRRTVCARAAAGSVPHLDLIRRMTTGEVPAPAVLVAPDRVEDRRRPEQARPDGKAALLPLVAACPDRGSVLPHALQPSCGCAELTECRAGRGKRRGRVTLAECLACVAGSSREPGLTDSTD